ncbi:NAD(P)-binding protein [Gonapodya prolifera JEL478]|uniref:NAD(P)-binding protein n=1 Tax=Gonapodya prolifera (strain JEL478) TaxID=1344416 RepID=A0A139AAE4_GONPJ|nr:NAD(P)-binding protein [Gonapodya prolifera JEL478]|eukprot:KXS13766.1 NAD(P)-binding protein [Gonapodya prolifera JEL478]
MPHTVLVLGGTGLIGRLILSTFLAKGHPVVAYSRNISKLPPELSTKYPTTFVPVQGSLDNESELKAALTIRPVTVVVSSVGPVDGRGHEVGSIARGYRVLAKTMKEPGVRTVYALAAIVGMVGALIPAAKAELIEIAKTFNEGNTFEGLDWVVYLFGMLKDGEPTTVEAQEARLALRG